MIHTFKKQKLPSIKKAASLRSHKHVYAKSTQRRVLIWLQTLSFFFLLHPYLILNNLTDVLYIQPIPLLTLPNIPTFLCIAYVH